MSKSECLGGQWKEAGYEDASRGRTDTRLAERTKACAKHDVQADEMSYDEGYKDGLQTYCSIDNAVEEGRSAREYRGICPAAIEPGFLRAYIGGLEIAVDDYEDYFYDLRRDLRHARILYDQAETSAEKARLFKEIDTLKIKLDDIRSERNEIRATIVRWSQSAY